MCVIVQTTNKYSEQSQTPKMELLEEKVNS